MPVDFQKLADLRRAAGLTQQQAAAAVGLSSRQAWNNIERGRQENLTVGLLDRIAAALGVAAKDLLK